MKKITRVIVFMVFFALLLSSMSVVSMATSKNGWHSDDDGKDRYYVNGEYVTGVYQIGNFKYVFGSDGSYVMPYDAYTPIGTPGVMDSSDYATQLSGRTDYAKFSLNVGADNKYRGTSSTGTKSDIYDGLIIGNNTSDVIGYITSDLSSTPNFQMTVKKSYFYLESKDGVDTSNLALRLVCSEKTTSVDSYVNINMGNTVPLNSDVIIEAEYKLGEDYSYKNNLTLMQVIDRSKNAYAENLFTGILTLNTQGYVYANNHSSSEFICKLTSQEYTRISVSLHLSTNTFDVYCNGIKVLEGVTFETRVNVENAKKIRVQEVRTCQFNGNTGSQGSIYLDNMHVYSGAEPVCLNTTEQLKNGAYAEGAFLRYYQNGLIVTGDRTVNGTFFGIVINKRLFFDTKSAIASVGCVATVKVGDKVISSEMMAANIFTAPSAENIPGKKFVGWKLFYPSGDFIIMSPGQSTLVTSDVIVEAFGVDSSTLTGASVKTVADATGLRFISKISKSDYDALIASGAVIEPHMLIVPTQYFENTHGYYTAKALADAGYTDFLDITAGDWYTQTDNYYYYTASIDLSPENFEREYSVVGYLKITLSNGFETIVYNEYKKEDNSRSLYAVAKMAYNDRTTESGHGFYSNVIKLGLKRHYSPYGSNKLDVLKSFIDRFILVSVDQNQVDVDGKFYKAPYTINSSYNSQNGTSSITVKAAKRSDWTTDNLLGVAVNGQSLSPGKDYQVSDNVCTFSIEMGVISLAPPSEEQLEFEKWTFFNATKSQDATYFSGYETKDTPSGASKAFKWSFTRSAVSFNPSGVQSLGWGVNGNMDMARYNTQTHSSGVKILDMSDWELMSLSVYAEESDVGASFYLLFYSENTATEGIDYYGKKFTVSNAGWNNFVCQKAEFGPTRTPLGWDAITRVEMTSTGWSQTNSTSTNLYFDSMFFYDHKDALTSISTHLELDGAAVFSLGGSKAIVDLKKRPILPGSEKAIVFEENGTYYLPISPIASQFAKNPYYYSLSNTLKFEYDRDNYIFTEGSSYTKNGNKVNLSKAAKLSNGMLFFALEDVMSIFGYSQSYIDRMGLIVLSNTPAIYDQDRDYDTIYFLIKECMYQRPTGEQILSDLNNHSGGTHPYLMMNQSDFDHLKYYREVDITMQRYVDNLEKSYGIGSSNFNAPPNVYNITDGVRLLSISRNIMQKVLAWSTLYKLYENSDPSKAELYAERVWIEVQAAGNFPDWNPSHFLDVAEIAYPVAIAYDWLYDYWTAERRVVIEDMLYQKALKQTNTLGGSYGLSSATNNWNGVCNGGIMSAALAIANVSRYQSDVIKILGDSIRAIERGMWVYGPDGGYEEGPGYWGYGTTYTYVFISSLDSACGTNYGIYYSPGFAHSVYFTTYLAVNNSTWGFHDSGEGSSDTNIAAWFAKKAGDPNVNAIRRQAIDNGWKGSSVYDVLNFSPHVVSNSITVDLDAYYSLDAIMTFRSSWNPKNTLFAGLHGGDNAASHGDLDIGNFVINVNGTFIIGELGSDSYNMVGYFGGYRWSYYRKRAEGQNTMVMLPVGQTWNGKSGKPAAYPGTNSPMNTDLPTPDQLPNAVSKALRYESNAKSAIGVVDMSPAYTNMTEGVRGLYFRNNRSVVVIQDEAVFDRPMNVWWFAHTKGNITVSADGKSAVIARGGYYLYAELVTDVAGAKFTAMDANSLDPEYVGDTTPSPQGYDGYAEIPRTGITKLCVTASNVNSLKLAIAFTVISSPTELPQFGTIYQWTDIQDWTLED